MKKLNNFLNWITTILLSAYGVNEQKNYVLILQAIFAVFNNGVEVPNTRFLLPQTGAISTFKATIPITAGDSIDVRAVGGAVTLVSLLGSVSALVSVEKVG